MSRRSILIALIAVLSAAALWSWLLVDHRRRVSVRVDAHRRLVETVLAATEGALFREFRGGRYDSEELTNALADLRDRTGARWLAVVSDGGVPLASTGPTPGEPAPGERFTREFLPPRPRGGGRGPNRPGSGLEPVPAGRLDLVMDYPRDTLDEERAGEFQRLLQVGIGLSAVILLATTAIGLRLRSASLRERLAASREKLRALDYLGRLGAGLVHETKNPLGVVRGFAERLEADGLTEPERRRAVRAILSETDRAVARLDEFLLLSRPSGLRRTDFDLAPLLAELAELLGPDLDARRASIDCPEAFGPVSADREQVRRLLLNLLLNAVAALPEGGRIEVRTEAGRAASRLVILDDGCGIPEELRDSLFEPYVTGRAGGTGLGLSIARRIALDHGWRLSYEPRSGGGSRFVLEIPSP